MVRPCAISGINVPVRSDKMVVNSATRTPCRPKRTWTEAAKRDTIVVNLIELQRRRSLIELNEEKGFHNRAKEI